MRRPASARQALVCSLHSLFQSSSEREVEVEKEGEGERERERVAPGEEPVARWARAINDWTRVIPPSRFA